MEPKYHSHTDFKLCLSLFQLKTHVFINCKIPILKPKSSPNTPIIPLSFPRKTDLLEKKQVKILEFLHDSKPNKINWYVISPWLKSVINFIIYIYIYITKTTNDGFNIVKWLVLWYIIYQYLDSSSHLCDNELPSLKFLRKIACCQVLLISFISTWEGETKVLKL